jgi:hypothetical protein
MTQPLTVRPWCAVSAECVLGLSRRLLPPGGSNPRITELPIGQSLVASLRASERLLARFPPSFRDQRLATLGLCLPAFFRAAVPKGFMCCGLVLPRWPGGCLPQDQHTGNSEPLALASVLVLLSFGRLDDGCLVTPVICAKLALWRLPTSVLWRYASGYPMSILGVLQSGQKRGGTTRFHASGACPA